MSTTPDQDRTAKLAARFGASEQGNFYVKDTIGVPHPFCVTPKHITAAQAYGGMLGREAIESLEKKTGKPSCGMRGCNLRFAEHEQALLVACKAEMKDADGKAVPELHSYLLKCKNPCEEDHYAGFAFLKERA